MLADFAINRRRRILSDLRPAREAGMTRSRSGEQFAAHDYLKQVYTVYQLWERRGLAERNSKRAAKYYGALVPHDAHPMRLIIDVTCSSADHKRRSCWVRALQYAEKHKVRCSHSPGFSEKAAALPDALARP